MLSHRSAWERDGFITFKKFRFEPGGVWNRAVFCARDQSVMGRQKASL